MKLETKYKGSLKLAAIGDALGWMTEFERNQDSLMKRFDTDYINEFYDWEKYVGGRFYSYLDKLKAGSYSDDTQLLLSVARSIKKDGIVDQEYFAKKELPNWLLYSRGAGRTIKNAARKIKRKSVKWNSNFFTFKARKTTIDYRESGANGAAMRVLPIALANHGRPDKIIEEIFRNSIITHGHPRAILGAMLYGYAVNSIIDMNPDEFNWEEYLIQLGLDFPTKFELAFIDNVEIQEWLYEWNRPTDESFESLYLDTIKETQNLLRYIYKSIKKDLSILETLTKIGCFDPATKGSGVATVVAGIYLSLKLHNKPLDAILEAVNALGSDTDSIAAFIGGLVGALHGENIIPDKWQTVQDIDYIEELSVRMLEISEGMSEFNRFSIKETYKSLSKIQVDNYEIEEKVYLETLGIGTVKSIDRQKTLTKGKYNLILDVIFDNGQFCRFAKLLSNRDNYNVDEVV